RLEPAPPASPRKPAAGWLAEVRSLFDDEKAPELHGRLVVLGLAMLDPGLAQALAAGGFLDALRREIQEGLESLLTPEGHRAWQVTTVLPDTVPTLTDQPSDVDLLARKAFAESLAIRIQSNHAEEVRAGTRGSFMLHVHGPWGSGKTTLLRFLRQALAPAGWVVVDFNAWQHQRVGAPWWWLMDALYRQGRWQVGLRRGAWVTAREWAWRLAIQRGRDLLLGSLLLFALAAAFHYRAEIGGWVGSLAGLRATDLDTYGTLAKAVTAILGLLTALVGAALAFGRALRGPAQPGKAFLETSRDPMGALREHFRVLLGLLGKPVAIFVDDLDRCQGAYVVELLDGIQTLFRDAPVTYVVAADRRWLRASYETAYQPYVATVHDPGQPLGYLFLDKAFQLSASVPRLAPDVMRDYWRHLLRLGGGAGERERTDAARARARERVTALRTEQELIRETEQPSGDPVYDRVLREEAVKRMAAPEVESHTRHVLLEFAPRLEPNPRAMKRLVNAYGVQRAVATLAGVGIDRRRLALWTIVTLRWPLLAEYLERHPATVNQLVDGRPPEDLDPSLQRLFRDRDVVDTVRGADVGVGLDEDTILACVSLRAAAAADAPRAPAETARPASRA
ncbi:MAG TPA: P-loop NTPase fold protein, partial [Methylomirabilota bacterium]|nr:P-loop NTPase fold protein [Methylomirabilota bacterium]